MHRVLSSAFYRSLPATSCLLKTLRATDSEKVEEVVRQIFSANPTEDRPTEYKNPFLHSD